MVLKVTSVTSRQQREIAEKEAKLLSRLSHPSIIKMFDTCYRSVSQSGSKRRGEDPNRQKERPQHLILMELCEGGHCIDVCSKMASAGERYDLSTLIIAFGQICNAVSYLHAQRPPIVHRDLKPANFLIKNGAYKLCDFGSAVFGHVDLKTTQARQEAEEVIEKTTTQMFRAPEMVDLFTAKRLTQATDVWALGCCLYSMAYLQNCFEEGSNLAILSRKYKIPDDNPYGDGLVELIDRMLTVDSKARADMTEVILCLSAVYSGRTLPPRKERKESKKAKDSEKSSKSKKKKKNERAGTFRTDGQGIYQDGNDPDLVKKPAVAKKLNPNSAAARRRQAAGGGSNSATASGEGDNAASGGEDFESFSNRFDKDAAKQGAVNTDMAFSTTDNFFSDTKSENSDTNGDEMFAAMASFDDDAEGGNNVQKAFGNFEAFASFPQGDESGSSAAGGDLSGSGHRRSNSSGRRARRKPRVRELADGIDNVDINDEGDPPGNGEEEGQKSSSRSRRTRGSRSGSDHGRETSRNQERRKKPPPDPP